MPDQSCSNPEGEGPQIGAPRLLTCAPTVLRPSRIGTLRAPPRGRDDPEKSAAVDAGKREKASV